jgi:hypothetical protein
MVVLQLDIVSITVFESKCYSPVSRDGNSPSSLSRAFQLVQLPTGKVHIRHFPRRVENVKLAPDSVSVLGRNASKIA